jgi:hypothetical protein
MGIILQLLENCAKISVFSITIGKNVAAGAICGVCSIAQPARLFVSHGKKHRAIMQAGQPFV